jgi:hypothetical protein
MSSNVPIVHDDVFCKTEKGKAELELRQAGLNIRQRSVLIMLDGRKRLRDIETLLPAQVLQDIMAVLMERELIAPANKNGSQSALRPVGSTVAAIAPREASVNLIKTKQLLIQAAETYLGLLAADVVRRVERASDEAELQSVLGHWNMAMHESKLGRQVARVKLEEIKACLRGDNLELVQPG